MTLRKLTLFASLILACQAGAQDAVESTVDRGSLGETRNVHVCGSLFLAGQPTEDDVAVIKQQGIKRVISLRQLDEVDWDEAARFQDAGIEFAAVPFQSPESLTDRVFQDIRQHLRSADKEKTLLHCGSANRVGAVWMVFRVLDQGADLEAALAEAKTVGLRNPEYEKKAIDFIQRNRSRPRTSVQPGINDNFLNADLDIEQWVNRFEVESREVYAARSEVLAATGVKEGSTVADIGSGTGLYTGLFSKAVGQSGWVYAVDISPKFVQHLNARAKEESMSNVTTVLGHDDSICLPASSIDFAFVCDTYHHFEFPHETLESIHKAMKTQGRLIVIDFNRIPGVTREWTINHVRAGKEVFRGEIESAGFEFVAERQIAGFKENYFLEFRKR